MAAYMSSLFADAAFSVLVNNVTLMTITSGAPANASAATTGFLASVTGSAGIFTIAAATSGRQVTIAQITGASVTNTGTADHLNLLSGNSILYYGTTVTSQVLTAGNSLTVNSWVITIKNPNQ